MKTPAILSQKNMFLKIVLFLTPFIIGGYHIWISALFSVILCGYLAFNVYHTETKERKTKFGISLLSLLLIPISYLIVSLWAVDSGTAVYGFVKFLPVAFFGIAVAKTEKGEREELLDVIPVSAVAMGVISYGLSFIPSLSPYLLVATRLGGFFQYPNSFAVYCLAGFAILLLKEKVTYRQWILAALLMAIIFLTGSRTVFVFLVAVCAFLIFRIKSKNRFILAGLIGAAIVISVIVVVVTDNVQTVGRYLTISLQSSTLLGRLLYYKDALPAILKHPFGLGYYGYYFSQSSFQTGVYSVAAVHNDFLQLLLDIGWIPSLLFFFAAGMSFLSKKTSVIQKTVMFIILGHSFFDFDLQFISVFFILVLTLDFEYYEKFSVKNNRTLSVAIAAVVSLVSVYFGIINGFFLLGRYDTVEKIYGRDTQSQIFLMTEADSYNEIADYADSILSRNKYMAIAYDAKANQAFEQGDVEKVIEYKEKALECSPYSINEYNDYCEKLATVIMIYSRNGDAASAQYCAEKLIGVQDKIDETLGKTSSLAWKIKDTPELELEEAYRDYIKELKHEIQKVE